MRQHSELSVFIFFQSPHCTANRSRRVRGLTSLGSPRKWVPPDLLNDPIDGFLLGKTHILIDHDTKFFPFRDFLEQNMDVEPVLTPPRSTNCNAHIERFMLGLKSECRNRMIFFDEASLRKTLVQFEEHYHTERNHQGLENQIIEPMDDVAETIPIIECRELLGGLLRYYHRRAA